MSSFTSNRGALRRTLVRLRRLGAPFAYLVAAAGPVQSAPPLRLERVAILMRHGVRPPTKDPAMPAGVAAEAWPRWDTKPGELTAHGAAAVRALGTADRRRWGTVGLLPARGCPASGEVRLLSDSDQRTIATGDAWAAGLAPGCAIANRHHVQDDPDPLFLNAGENGEPFDLARADAAVASALGSGGVAAVEAAQRPVLARLDAILCGAATGACGVTAAPSRIPPAAPRNRPKLEGALDRGSTAAQILLLEYAEGKPMREVGWGRASAADVTALSALHATEFAILARPSYLAAVNSAPLARTLLAALTDRDGAKVTALVGHDTNVASLGGLLGFHWQVPGYAADDPPPGGAILLERWRDPQGRRYVRARLRAQSLGGLRSGSSASISTAMTIEGCPALCPLPRFAAMLRAKLAAAGLSAS